MPTGVSNDYSECGKRALRNTSSRILVDTIEEAVRSGGVSLFDSDFRLDSSVSWVWGENVTGDLDAVVPLLLIGKEDRGSGHALFLQPGLVFWTGLEEQDRFDGNLGVVYRFRMADGLVAGGSFFYDHDFKNGNRRIGAGLDLQGQTLRAGLNYYRPLSEWQEGRTGYEERPLQGGDFRLGIILQRAWLDASAGIWRFEGEDEEKEEWRPSFGVDAGIRIFPGVFIKGGYEWQDKDDSFGMRWNTGLAFRFALPGMDGADSFNNPPVPAPNLFEPVNREKRILYEERLGIPRVNLSATVARIGEPAADEGGTVTFTAELGKALEEDVTLHVLVAETSTATLGTDFTYGYRVYDLNEETGEQSAPAGDATDCPEEMCVVPVPAGVTRFDVEAEILMTAEREIPEFIDFQIEVPEEHSSLLRGSGTARVTIEGHGNEIGFVADAVATLAEDNETTGVEVQVSIDEPSPAPITLNVALSGTATVNEDYRINTTTLRIPANASSASLRLTGINNDRGEGSKSIILTISGNLPEGWTITDDEHTVTLRDDDLSIFFTGATPSRVEEPDSGNETVTVAVGITQPPSAEIAVRVTAGGTAEQGSGGDYTFTAEDITFGPSDHADKTFTFDVHADNGNPDLDKTIILTLADMGTQAAREDDGFSLGSPHTITIPANDNTVGFASATSRLTEGNGITAGVTVNVNLPSPVPITLNVTTGGTATEGRNGDYTISSRTLTIGANRSSGTITLTSRDEGVSEALETIDLVISAAGGLPSGWTFGTTRHEVTLVDLTQADGTIGIGSPNAATLNEVADGTEPAFIDVPVAVSNSPALARVLSNDITLAHTLSIPADENSDPGDDVVFTDVTLDAATGEGSARIEVSRDNFSEDEEVVTVTIMAGETNLPTGWFVDGNNNTYTVTIPANDNTITFIEPFLTSIAEMSGRTSITTRINRPLPSGATATVTVTPTSTSLVQDTDYSLSVSGGSLSGNTWTLPTGVSEPTLTVTALSDISANATLTLEFAGGTLPDAWKVAGDTSHDITITDSATPARPTVGFVEASSTVDEPATGFVHRVQVRVSEAPVADFTVVVTSSGSATLFSDYTRRTNYTFGPTRPLNFAGEVTLVSDNNIPEEDETIILTLSDDYMDFQGRTRGLTENGNNFEISRAVHTVTIRANDNTVGFADAKSGAVEGETGTDVAINIDRPFPAGTTASVQVDIENNGTTATSDYTITGDNYSNGVLTLPTASDTPNGTTTLTVTAVDGAISSGDEGITLTLRERGNSFPPGWDVGEAKHDVVFIDSAVGKTIGFATPGEGDAFNPVRIFEENPTSGMQQSVTVRVESILPAPSGGFDLAWEVGSMEGGDQVTSTSGDIDFSAGDEHKEFTLMIDNDSTQEGETPVTVRLSTPTSLPTGWNFGVQEYIFTIEPSDSNVTFSDSTNATTTANEGDTLTFELAIEAIVAPSTGLPISILAQEGNAGEDLRFEGTVIIPAGQSRQSFTVEVIDDAVAENAETYNISMTLGADFPHSWGVVGGTRTITINASDLPTIGFAQTTSSAFEGDNHRIEFDVDSRYVVPDAGFTIEDLEVTGALGDASYNSTNLVDGLDVTVLPGANTGDKPYFIVDITEDGVVNTHEDAETLTFTLPDSIKGFFAGTNTSHTLTIEPSNNQAFFSRKDGATDHLGRVAENATSVDAIVTLFEYGAPSGGLPLKLQVTDNFKKQINVDTTSQISLSSDLNNPTNEVNFVVPAGMTTYPVPIYVRDNSATADHDPVYLTLLQGDNFPDGWGEVDLDFNRYTLTIIDDEGTNLVGFSSSRGTASESVSGTPTVSTNITIDPVPTQETVIPVTFSGNAASYEIASDPAGALTRADGAATGTVTFAANQGSIELTLTAQDDDNAVTDTIRVGIDDSDASFPAGYSSADATWTVEVADKGPDTIGWLGWGRSFPTTTGVADKPTEIMVLQTLSVDITETWPDNENSNVPLLLVMKDGDGNVYAKDSNNLPGTSPHNTKYQDAGSINPPVTFYVRVTGTAYGSEERRNADNDGDGQADGEDGNFHIFHPNNTFGGGAFSFRDTREADPATGGIEFDGINRLNIQDDVPEYAENFILTLEEGPGGMLPEGWELEDGRTVLTVNVLPSDNTITFSEPSLSDIYEKGGTATITATINNPILAGKTASIAITPGGTAVRDTDYTLSVSGGSLSGNTWTLPTGQSTATLTVTAIEDAIAESPNETVELALAGSSLPAGWTVTETTHTITIDENDPSALPTVSLNYSGSTTIPSSGSNRMTIVLSKSLTQNVTVTLTPGGTASYASTGTGIWSLLYDVLPAGTTTPPAMFPTTPDGTCSPAEATSSTGCRIEIPAGRTVVDVNAAAELLSSEQTIMVTLGIDSMSSSHVELGTPTTVELTAQ